MSVSGAHTHAQTIDHTGALAAYPSQGTLMAVGVEPAHIRGCLLEPVSDRYRLVGWLGLPRREPLSIAGQTATLCRELGRRLQRRLWNDTMRTPFLVSEQPLRQPPIEHLAFALSPIELLRIVVLGLTASQSTAWAAQAAAGGPGEVVSVQHYTHETSTQMLADELRTARADILLLVGGHDAEPPTPHHSFQALLNCAANALNILPPALRPEVHFAGGRWAGIQAERIFTHAASTTPVILPNVMPSPTQLRADTIAQALHTLYAARAQQTPGYAELAAWANSASPPTTLESNFARLVRAWRELHDLSDLHGLYIRGDLWLHVWATARTETVQLHYRRAQGNLQDAEAELDDWPSTHLVSGGARPDFDQLPALRWWDRGALAPIVAALGATAPLAVRQVLETNILLDVNHYMNPAPSLPRSLLSNTSRPSLPRPGRTA